MNMTKENKMCKFPGCKMLGRNAGKGRARGAWCQKHKVGSGKQERIEYTKTHIPIETGKTVNDSF